MKCKECHLEKGHKMDCSGNFGQKEIIHAPTILYVKDDKHHVISHTIVDYNRVEEILSKISNIMERNCWHHEITVLPSESYFLGTIYSKDLS